MAQNSSINPKPHEVNDPEMVEQPIEVILHEKLTEQERLLYIVKTGVQYLCELADRLASPAQLSTVVLDASAPVKMADERQVRTASIGIWNPGDFTVLLGLGGGRATIAAQAWQVPPQSLMVIPVAAGDVEIGTEDSLAAGPAVVHLLRYNTVQPAFLGVVPPAGA